MPVPQNQADLDADVAVHTHKAVSEDPEAQEAPELPLDEPLHRTFAGLRAARKVSSSV
ncbi:MAG: hypothetical protein GY937_10415 [bacterium]|nr:hypothetical protein [bacterium]